MSRISKVINNILSILKILTCFLLCIDAQISNEINETFQNESVPTTEYLVFSPNCQMLSLDPFAPNIMKLLIKDEYEPCTNKSQLTSISQDFEANSVQLVYHDNFTMEYYAEGHDQIECCYQEITRVGGDDEFFLTKCTPFNETFNLPAEIEFILVHCSSFNSTDEDVESKSVVYVNAHAIVRRKQRTYPTSERPLSILMLGIDSISRLNLIRAMPVTSQYLNDTGWFELMGYNKMEDNTFPNLMAVLTGYNLPAANDICNPRQSGQMEKCPFIWKDFQNSGYVTAYAEDEASISTFNYHKTGFVEQPTTHYFRPFALAAEKFLDVKHKNSLKFCLGFQNYADYIYSYAIDFATAYRDDPTFGLFWTNTFSHNDISDPTSMDERMKYYLAELENRGILESSAVVFFSDHGIRFGPARQLFTGYLEERLPFFYIWLPPWFKEKHPDLVENLEVNKNRLTSPYDLHMTLKHILELSGRVKPMPSALSCAECQSILKPMPWNRSCSDAGIDAHWCTCSAYSPIESESSSDISAAVKYVIDWINKELRENARTPNGDRPLCEPLQLRTIFSARQSNIVNSNSTSEHVNYLIVFNVSPSYAKFETTISSFTHAENKFEITGTISRLNEYGKQSSCVDKDYLRKYCYCIKKKKKS